MLPVVQFEFDKEELTRYRAQKEQAEAAVAAERERIRQRAARGKLEELTQAHRIDVCFNFSVL